MEIRDNKKVCIIAPISNTLDKYRAKRIIKKIEEESRNIAIDLKYVSDCTIDFIESIVDLASKKDIGVFNIPSDIFVLFNIMNIDKSLKLYVSEIDFEEKSRQLINRKFSLI